MENSIQACQRLKPELAYDGAVIQNTESRAEGRMLTAIFTSSKRQTKMCIDEWMRQTKCGLHIK